MVSSLTASQQLERVGGAAELAALIDAHMSSANVGYYARIVHERALLRRVISLSNEHARRAAECPRDVLEFLDHIEAEVYSIADRLASQPTIRIGDHVIEYHRKLEQRLLRGDSITGLATGFADLDRMTGGLQAGDLVVLAARPSIGKSALALNIAEHVAIDCGVGVVLFSLEMSKDQLEDRLYAGQARVDLNKLRLGSFSSDEKRRVAEASRRIEAAPLYIDDTAAVSPCELRSRARRVASNKEAKLALVIVDYLQLVRVDDKGRSREQEIAEVSRSLKALAKELHLPVLALAQLNREVESRNPPIPRMSDLRDSGQIEQDADVIMLLYRADAYQRDVSRHDGNAELIIEKQRNGPKGSLPLTFIESLARFENREFSQWKAAS
jgi:replicative DNA helicase